MARLPTTTDAFNAVADGSRRDLLDAIGADEATVGDLVDRLGLSNPSSEAPCRASDGGVVSVRTEGRHRWYRIDGPKLQPIFEWVRGFESTWNARLDRLDDALVELQTKEKQT